MLVPHDNERVRSFQVSGKSIRAAASALLMGALLLGTFSIAFFVKQSKHVQNASLRAENDALASEVDEMRKQMEALDRSIAALTQKDEELRVVAGLPEIDPDVRRVGIGGPGSTGGSVLARLNPRVGRKVETTGQDLSALTRRAALLRSSMDEALTTIERNRERMASTPTILPANGHLSSLFSGTRYHPVLRVSRPHKGIDIAARVGEPILAAARGRVIFAGNRSNGYGNMVEIDHGNGVSTRYAHLSAIVVAEGETVRAGAVVGRVGTTGRSTGPHLHYETRINDEPVDPHRFLRAGARLAMARYPAEGR
jgi:murein DD-endopeptidase MepM/ murein hydrolase activator NlpD